MYESMYVYYPCVSSILLLGHQGIMLVYDVTKEESFDNITNWIRDIEEVSHNINNIYKQFCGVPHLGSFVFFPSALSAYERY